MEQNCAQSIANCLFPRLRCGCLIQNVLKFPSLSRWIRTIGLKTKWETAKARKAFFSLSGWSGKDVAACLRRIEGVWGLEFVDPGANEHLLRQVREDDMKSSATPQDNVGQQWHIQYVKMMDNENNGKGDSKQDWKRCFCQNWGAQAHPGSQAVSRGSVEVTVHV